MKSVAFSLVGLLAFAPLSAAVRFLPDADLEFRNEPGVETKLMLRGLAHLELCSWADAFGGAALAVGNNPGLAHYGLGLCASEGEDEMLRLRVQVNHDNWSSWHVGENRLTVAVEGKPFRNFDLAAGLAYRLPLFDANEYSSPFVWRSDAPEWNIVYRLDWTFLQRPLSGIGNRGSESGSRNPKPETRVLSLGVWMRNFDLLTMHSAQQFPFGLRGRLDMDKHWHVNLQLGSNIKGLSGLLFSLGELDIRAGGGYEF